MSQEEYSKLKAMISSLILNEEIPYVEAPIRRLGVSNQAIIYSFYKISIIRTGNTISPDPYKTTFTNN